MAKHPAKCPKCGSRLEFDSATDERIVCPQCGAVLAAPGKSAASQPADPLVGQSLGEFEILELLGRGGMGAVYKARQASLDRLVALKVLPQQLAADVGFVERFNREARAAAAVRHPNIIEIFAVGEHGGRQYIAMEFIDGETLGDLLKREGRLAPDRALEVMRAAASALAEAHECGILHRDIKPSNILLDRKGRVKVADFGLAKRPDSDVSVTVTGAALGTPLYMPPEAGRGTFDVRSDLYSLGATFYQALAGRPPFSGSSGAELILKHAEDRVPPLGDLAPDAPPALCRLIHRLLRKSPTDRYASAEKLLDALTRVEARLVGGASPSRVGHVAATAPPLVDGAASTPTLAAQARPPHRTTGRRKAVGGTSPSRVLTRKRVLLGGTLAAALVLIVVLILVVGRGRRRPSAVTPRPPASRVPRPSSRPPADPRLERNAAIVFNNIHACITRKDWSKARSYLDRLTTRYGKTEFAAAHKAAIAALQRQIDAYIKGTARPAPPKTSTPPEHQPQVLRKPQPPPRRRPGYGGQADDEARWTEWEDLFDGKTLGGWRVVEARPEFVKHGRVVPADGQLVLGRGDPATGIVWTRQVPMTDYELSLEALRQGGTGSMCEVIFPVGAQPCKLDIGGADNTLVYIEHVDGRVGPRNVTARKMVCEDGRWYRIRLRVTAAAIQVWVDEEKVVDFDPTGHRFSLHPHQLPLKPFGLRTWKTASTLRHIRLRRLKPEPAEEWSTLPNGWRVGKPVNLGPRVNTAHNDTSPELSADGLTLLFPSQRPGGHGHHDLWTCTRTSLDEPFAKPVNLGAPVNSAKEDVDPTLSSDGLTLIFVSDRPGGQGDRDLWMATRPSLDKPFGEPVNLGRRINAKQYETHPALSADGLTLYFSCFRPGVKGGENIWMATRPARDKPFGKPVRLPAPVNVESMQRSPALSADGLALFFASWRRPSQGKFDLWMCTRASPDVPFGDAVNLGPTVNSASDDCGAALSPDARTLFFHSRRPGGHGGHDLWMAPIAPPLPPADAEGWRTLFDGKSLKGWSVSDGSRGTHVANGAIQFRQEKKGHWSIAHWGGVCPSGGYELEFEARRADGSRGLGAVTFPVGASRCTWLLGGQAGALFGLAYFDGKTEGKHRQATEAGRWYRLRLHVAAGRIHAKVDGRKVLDVATAGHKIIPYTYIGARGALTLAAHAGDSMRAIRLRRLKAEPPADDAARWGPWEELFDGKSLKGWEAHVQNQACRVADGRIVIDAGGGFAKLHSRRALPKMDYEIEAEAMRVEGNGAFCNFIFHAAESRCRLSVGSTRGEPGYVGLGLVNGKPDGKNETTQRFPFEQRRWYKIKVRVTRGRIQVWADDTRLINLDTAGKRLTLDPNWPKPLVNFAMDVVPRTTTAIRAIRFRRLKPEPAAAAARWGPWEELFDGKSLAGWKVSESEPCKGHGPVTVEDGRIVLGLGKNTTALVPAFEFPRKDYQFEYVLMALQGEYSSVGLNFPVGRRHSKLCVSQNVTTKQGNRRFTGLLIVDGKSFHANPTSVEGIALSQRRWYRIRVSVVGARVEAWVDDRQIVDFDTTGRALAAGYHDRIGAMAIAKGPSSHVVVRSIRLRRLKPEGEAKPPR